MPEYPCKPAGITSEELLSNESGIMHYNGEGDCSENYDKNKRDMYIANHTNHYDPIAAIDIFKEQKICFEPGESYQYSTWGFCLMAAVIERASSKTYQELLFDNIVCPLNLPSLQIEFQDRIPYPNEVKGYKIDGSGDAIESTPSVTDVSYKTGGGGLIGSVVDLTLFIKGIVNSELLSQSTIDLMGIVNIPNDGIDGNYGYGTRSAIRNGEKLYWHRGDQSKTTTIIYYSPENKNGVALMCNTEDVRLLPLARLIYDYLPSISLNITDRYIPSDNYWSFPGNIESGIYESSNTIESNGSVGTNENITFKSNECAILNEGFEVVSGGELVVTVDDSCESEDDLGGVLVDFNCEPKTPPNVQSSTFFGGYHTEIAFSIQQTTDGGFVVAGRSESNNRDVGGNNGSSDSWILKLDNSGNLEWEKNFGGTGVDNALSIQQTTDGGFVVAGGSKSNDRDVGGNNGSTDYWILKLDNSGNLEWEKNFGGAGRDQATSIQQTTDGGFVVAGDSESNDGDVGGNNGSDDYWILKLDNSGNLEWEKNFGGSGVDRATSIQQTTEGGFVVAGQSELNDGDVGGNYGSCDYWILKLDNSGNLEWEKNFGGSGHEQATSIQQTTDGGFVVAGHSSYNDRDVGGNYGSWDYWILKLDNSGNLEWEKNFGGSGYDSATSIQQTTDEGFVVAGSSSSNDGDLGGNNGQSDYWILKLDNSGNLQWEKNFGGSGQEQVRSIQQTTDGGFVVAGYSSSSNGDVGGNNGSFDYWVLKLSGI